MMYPDLKSVTWSKKHRSTLVKEGRVLTAGRQACTIQSEGSALLQVFAGSWPHEPQPPTPATNHNVTTRAEIMTRSVDA